MDLTVGFPNGVIAKNQDHNEKISYHLESIYCYSLTLPLLIAAILFGLDQWGGSITGTQSSYYNETSQ